MIARIWKGWTSKDDAATYEKLFRDTVLPKVTQGVDGFISTDLLRREDGDEIEFTTIFWFDSLDSVKNFAGPNYEQAVIPNEVKRVLSHYEETVHHHEVTLQMSRNKRSKYKLSCKAQCRTKSLSQPKLAAFF